ncbi:hypothetical protein NPIL_592871 [Nephila pilipes]|uniref:Uncharacterized protein n=1 Tax=Nephila pilipes TaxID=299642 RepID=A0A8X6ITI8_NEPPI|nr:hypothetical protein NPIL_592871 [Nephila pilipes]
MDIKKRDPRACSLILEEENLTMNSSRMCLSGSITAFPFHFVMGIEGEKALTISLVILGISLPYVKFVSIDLVTDTRGCPLLDLIRLELFNKNWQ